MNEFIIYGRVCIRDVIITEWTRVGSSSTYEQAVIVKDDLKLVAREKLQDEAQNRVFFETKIKEISTIQKKKSRSAGW